MRTVWFESDQGKIRRGSFQGEGSLAVSAVQRTVEGSMSFQSKQGYAPERW